MLISKQFNLLLSILLLVTIWSFTSATIVPKTNSTNLTSFSTTLRKRRPSGSGFLKKPKRPKIPGSDDEDEQDEEDDRPFCEDLDGDGEFNILTECRRRGDDDDDDDDDNLCFPADAIVTVQNRGSIPIANLKIGDYLLLSDGSYSPVYHFSHAVRSGTFPFITFETDIGTLSASSGHFVYSHGKLVQADSLNVGDSVDTSKTTSVQIRKIKKEYKTGLYNPHTLQGELFVNGFRVSEFTKAAPKATAIGALAPLRALFQVSGIGTIANDKMVQILNTIVKTGSKVSRSLL